MNVVYVFGLFENKTDPLFSWLKNHTESLGVRWHGLEMYSAPSFGSRPILDELERAGQTLAEIKPDLIVAHSLGAYTAAQLALDCPVILLDPSLALHEIILPNTKKVDATWLYDDGEYRAEISDAFMTPLVHTPSIEESAEKLRLRNIPVHIFGAGKGGHKIAERYHRNIPNSRYTFLSHADHAFSGENERNEILTLMKKQLGATPSRSEDVRTRLV